MAEEDHPDVTGLTKKDEETNEFVITNVNRGPGLIIEYILQIHTEDAGERNNIEVF